MVCAVACVSVCEWSVLHYIFMLLIMLAIVEKVVPLLVEEAEAEESILSQ